MPECPSSGVPKCPSDLGSQLSSFQSLWGLQITPPSVLYQNYTSSQMAHPSVQGYTSGSSRQGPGFYSTTSAYNSHCYLITSTRPAGWSSGITEATQPRGHRFKAGPVQQKFDIHTTFYVPLTSPKKDEGASGTELSLTLTLNSGFGPQNQKVCIRA